MYGNFLDLNAQNQVKQIFNMFGLTQVIQCATRVTKDSQSLYIYISQSKFSGSSDLYIGNIISFCLLS